MTIHKEKFQSPSGKIIQNLDT